MENFTAIPCLTVLVYLLAEVFKLATKQQHNETVPVLCGLFGALLGGVTYWLFPELLAGGDLLSALAVGTVSGFSATGVHQIFRQTQNGE